MKKRKIIVPALLSIIGCSAVIAGSTYALFTSEAKVNVAITSGKVDVTAVVDGEISTSHKQWNTATNQYDDVEGSLASGTCLLNKQAQTIALTNILPGDKISFNIKIENGSTVNVKYRTVIKALEDAGLFDGLKITIDDEEFDGATIRTAYEDYAVGTGSKTVAVSVEMPLEAENYYQGTSCKLSYAVEAIQGNADTGVYEVTPSNAQEILDGITGEATVILTEGNYDTLYLRQDLDVSTRRTDLDKDSSYPGYYRAIKGLTIEAKEGATVTCDGIKAEAGLMWYSSAPASNQAAMGRENSGFLSYLSLEDITIDGIKFDNIEQSPIELRDNDAGTSSGTFLVNGFTVKNCTATGNNTQNIHFFTAGSGSTDKTFDDTNMNGFNNISLVGNTISSYVQTVHFNNSSAVLNGLKVKNNKITDSTVSDNVLQISNKVNKGRFVFSGNTIDQINGRFIRMANVDSSSTIVFSNNKITNPVKYDVDAPEVVKVTGTDGFTVYESGNDWSTGTASSGKYISLGNTALLPDGTY